MKTEQMLIEQLKDDAERFALRLPDAAQVDDLDQDEEWCELKLDGHWKRVRLHDYHEIYDVPGLYEKLFHRTLRCNSPRRVAGLFAQVLGDWPVEVQPRCVFDVGAGGGMVGAQMLEQTSAERVIGIDLISQARAAADRDRPWVYDDYFVANLCDLPEKVEMRIRDHQPDCLTTVAALGFGDIPTRAFITALDIIETPGWVVFNIKENFLEEASDCSGFAGLIHQLRCQGVLRVEAFRRYRHRISTLGKPLHYVAMVARKMTDVPDEYLD